jgi:FAD:protein FMN transferase
VGSMGAERHDEQRGSAGAAKRVSHSLLAAACLLFGACMAGRTARDADAPEAAAEPEQREAALSRFEFEHPAMGTLFEIELYAPDAAVAERAAAAAFDAVDRIEAAATDYDMASEARRLPELAANGSAHALSPELDRVVGAADAIVRLSAGAFDPTVGALTPEWRRALRRREWPDAARWGEASARVGWERLVEYAPEEGAIAFRAGGMRVDFGGVAKGVAVDAALEALAREGVTRALVDGGGDVAAGEPPPGAPGWRILVRPRPREGPGEDGGLREIRALLARGAVATSGDSYRNADALAGAPLPGVDDPSARFGHVIDPRTGLPLVGPRAAVVFAPTAAEADGLATALLVLGEAALDDPTFSAAAFFGGLSGETPCVGPGFPQDECLFSAPTGPTQSTE